MKIGLLGYGTVGKGFKEIIDKTAGFNIVKILVKKKRNDDIFVYDIDEVLNNDVDVVVECLSDENLAYECAKKVLSIGIPYISASKKMLAKHFDLFEIAQKNNTKLLFEASCGGGIPWFSNIKRIRQTDKINEIQGIMNGTCNYILSSIFNENKNFSIALRDAQELGYAETDPSDDILGYDTRYKLYLSILKAFDLIVDVDDIPCFGIDKLSDSVIDYAKKNNKVIKLIGYAKYDNGLCANVLPRLVSKSSVIGNINSNNNILMCTSNNLGLACFIGQGAGSLPTGFSLAQDLFELNEKEEVHTLNKTNVTNNLKTKFIITTNDMDAYKDYIGELLDINTFITKCCSLNDIEKIKKELFLGEIIDD